MLRQRAGSRKPAGAVRSYRGHVEGGPVAAVSRLVSRATDAGLTGIAAKPAADIAIPTETRRDTLGCDGTRAQAGHKRDTRFANRKLSC